MKWLNVVRAGHGRGRPCIDRIRMNAGMMVFALALVMAVLLLKTVGASARWLFIALIDL
jgi:hypothetical protein